MSLLLQCVRQSSLLGVLLLSAVLAGSGCRSSTGPSQADGGSLADGSTDGPRADAGPCATQNGGCDPLTVCSSASGKVECGPCPPEYTGDGHSGCKCSLDITAYFDPPVESKLPTLTNLAANRPYTLSPAPNYTWGSTCSECSTQLTDGAVRSDETWLWTLSSTVGWNNASPVITVDLGTVQPIRGASFHTAAGTSGARWPLEIYLYVADEPDQFHDVGRLVAVDDRHDPPSADAYGTHWYWDDQLRTHGRYVAFVAKGDPFVFVDEMQVFAGDAAWLDDELSGAPVARGALASHAAGQRERDGVLRRVFSDAFQIAVKARSAGLSEEARRRVACELAAATQAARLESAPGPGFRAVLPVSSRHARVFGAQALIWSARALPALVAWQSPLWGPLSPLADPLAGPPDVRVRMMRNEHRAAKLNLSNTRSQAQRLTLRIQGLPGGDDPALLQVHEVAWTDTARFEPVSTALPLAQHTSEGYVINVPAGMTREVWFDFHPREIPAGQYRGQIVITGATEQLRVPLFLDLVALELPAQLACHCYGFDYTESLQSWLDVTAENRDALTSYLKEYHVDTPVEWLTVLPFGSYDAAGHQTVAPSTAHFDRWIARWRDAARRYLVFLARKGAPEERIGSISPSDGAPFKAAVKAWATFWADYIKSKGLRPDQFLLLIVDEVPYSGPYATQLAWATALREANVGFRIFVNPLVSTVGADALQVLEQGDVVSPNRRYFLQGGDAYAEAYAQLVARGKELEFNVTEGAAKLLDPYAYYRLLPWLCWEQHCSGVSLWAFSDEGGGSSWNEYGLDDNVFTPFFLEQRAVTSAKQMEALREGLEDYEYLAMLRAAVARAEARNSQEPALANAKRLLDELPRGVAAISHQRGDKYDWRIDVERSLADRAREQILDALLALGQLP